MERLFRNPEKISVHDEVLLSYVTEHKTSVKVTTWINDCYKLSISSTGIQVMYDLTAGIGGNTLVFGEYYPQVHAVEINPDTASDLQKNIASHKLSEKVKVHNKDLKDFLEEIPKFPYKSGVFYDPPWGGSEYKQEDMIKDLTSISSNLGINDVIDIAKEKKADFIVIKIPFNIDLHGLFSQYRELYTLKIGNQINVFIPLL